MGQITTRELQLAGAIGAMGYVFASRPFLVYLNTLNPVEGLLLYYAVLYGVLFGLSRMGLTVFGFKIKDPTQTLGLLMVNFAFFATVDWSSNWVQYVVTGSLSGAANALTNNCEDGFLWWLVNTVLKVSNLDLAAFLAFAVAPFLIALVGLYFVEGNIKLQD